MAKKLIPPENGDSPVKPVEKYIRKYLIGQDRPIREIARALERAFSGLKPPDRPIATLAFFGPTGVGKTYAAELLADSFKRRKVWRCQQFQECGFQLTKEDLKKRGSKPPNYCPRHQNVRLEEIDLPNIWMIDCGGLGGSLDHAVTTLIGAPPSYVGHDDPPLFTGGKAPRVVLFDEAEKALLTQSWRNRQSTFASVLLKILDKGKIRNNHGEEIDFTQSVIILTGNLGAAEIIQEFEGRRIGFQLSGSDSRNISKMSDAEVMQLNERIYHVVKEKAQRELAPEFLNRLDRLVVFHFLTQGDYDQILELELTKVQNRINTLAKTRPNAPKFVVTYTTEARKALLDECMGDRSFGARALSRVIEKRVVTPLSQFLNNDLIVDGDHLEARVDPEMHDEDGKDTLAFFRLTPEESPLLLEAPPEEKSDE